MSTRRLSPPKSLPYQPTRFLAALAALLAVVGFVRTSMSAPAAKLLRIDPRASMVDGAPVLTTIVDLVQHKALSDVTSRCATLTGNANIDCLADEFEKPKALYEPFVFPADNAFLTVAVDGRDTLASLVEVLPWGKSKNQEGVGTAWLIVVDAASSMRGRFGEAKRIAREFINKMGPNDIVNVMFFNDRAVVRNSKWLSKKVTAAAFVDSIAGPFPRQGGRTRPLFNILKTAATDGFHELGNTTTKLKVPMHQAMVILSNGVTGSDIGSPSQLALALREYLTGGRFPKDNTTLPKAPVPIISIWFPTRQMEEFFQNARQFMENLANPEIGGFYSIVRDGQSQRAARIVRAVNRRFDGMHIVKWRVPCVAPKVSQTISLLFKNTEPLIAGDAFKDVPVGIDPTTWPLDIDVERTMRYAKKHRLHPGGELKIFGNFCWGSDHKRAQLYMIPKKQPAPDSLKGRSIEEARDAQKTLIASNLVGKAVSAGDSFVEFVVPDKTTFLSGKGKKMEARLVVADTFASRTSAITADKILTLPAMKKPFNVFLIGGLTFGGVVLLLLIIQIARGGGGRSRGRRGSSGGAPPPPVVAGGGYPPRGPGPQGPYGPQGPQGPHR